MRRAAILGIWAALAACGGGERPHPRMFDEPISPALTACASDAGVVRGIDVSKYDGTVDWHAVADAGYLFAISRVSDGLDFPDQYFAANWAGSKDAGLVRGVYQYFEPDQDPEKQAQLLLAQIADFGPGDLAPVIDVETLDSLDAGPATAAVVAWAAAVGNALHRRPIIYTSQRVWNEFGDPPLDADLWVANWDVTCPAIPSRWADAGWQMWQYADNGAVPGDTAEPADLDEFNGTLAQLKAYAGIPIAPLLQLESVQIAPASLDQGELLTATFKVKNLGQQAVAAAEPLSGTLYEESDDAPPAAAGAFRVALDTADRASSRIDHPWRWGLPLSLGPGEEATIIGEIRLSTPGQRTFFAAVIEEGTGATQDLISPTLITVGASDAGEGPPDAGTGLPASDGGDVETPYPYRGCETASASWLAALLAIASFAKLRSRRSLGLAGARGVGAGSYGGFGLGLLISRRIVEAHGGSISVQSAQGAGATFVVDLPLA